MCKSFWAVLLAAVASGCGNPEGLVPVSGKLLYHGEPARGAIVYFHRESGKGMTDGPVPFGIVEDDGSFNLNSDNLGAGALPGKYAVLVEWREEHGDGVTPVSRRGSLQLVKRSRVRAGADRLAGRYLDITKPRLHAEVLDHATRLDPFQIDDAILRTPAGANRGSL